MSEPITRSEPASRYSRQWPKNFLGVMYVILPVSFVVFLIAAGGERAWQIYLVNYLFWTGLAAAGVVLAAIWLVSDSVWGDSLRGVALAMASFLPASILLYLPLMAARSLVFPFLRHPAEHRAAWLSPGFLFARDLLSLAVFGAFASVFLYYSYRPTLGAAMERGATMSSLTRSFTSGWQGLAREQARSEAILRRLTPALLIVYAVVYSVIAWDLIMALDAHFYSTLFGPYFFMGHVYTALAALAVLIAFLLPHSDLGKVFTRDDLHQLGKLTFGLCMFQTMLFWSQYLVIWYGNLPEEIGYVLRRGQGAWGALSLAMLLMSLLIPFCVLLSRRLKQTPRALAALSVVILAGMWLELYVLVVPALWSKPEIPLGWLELIVTGGFFSLAMLTYRYFTRHFPILLLPLQKPPSAEHASPARESAHD